MSDDQLKLLGARGIAEVVARAVALMEAGVDRAIVVARLESAAEAFSAELDGTARLLIAAPPGGSRHRRGGAHEAARGLVGPPRLGASDLDEECD